VIARRRRNAALYRQHLASVPVFIPPDRNHEFNTFHTFVIQGDRRDELQARLRDRGIGTAIHYPVPIHLQPAARDLGYRAGDFPVAEAQAERILTLPINQFLTEDEIVRVAGAVGEFYGA
jgi:dTDP-4-amino-4,6-dideoxygalactose transaminase